MLAINSMPDHVHLFIGYYLNQLIPSLVGQVKTTSNQWIKEHRLSKFRFEWQTGYDAFTHSRPQIDRVVKYVLNQKKHHKGKSFKEEYLEILRRNEIDFAEQCVFHFFSNVD